MKNKKNNFNILQKQGTSQEICTGTFDGSGNLTHYNWDPKKIHPYTVIWIGTILLATCIMVFTEIGRHKAPKLRVNVPIGVGTKAPKKFGKCIVELRTDCNHYLQSYKLRFLLEKVSTPNLIG